MKLLVSFVLFLLSSLSLFSLDDWDYADIREYLVSVSDNSDVEFLMDRIEYYANRPINLKFSNTNQLIKIPGIDRKLANSLITYADECSVFSFRFIRDSLKLSKGLFKIVRNCTYYDTLSFDKQNNLFKQRISSEIPFNSSHGFENKSFVGDKYSYKQKTELEIDNFKFVFLSSKSEGESSYLDFYSAAINYNRSTIDVIIGDFTVKSAYSNIFGESFSSNKGTNIINPISDFSNQININKSSLDYLFFRGIAISKQIELNKGSNIELFGFASNINRSASIEDAKVVSLYKTGLFRTATEINKKDKLNEKSISLITSLNTRNSFLGFSFLYLNYSKELNTKSSNVFSGKTGMLKSIFASYNSGNLSFYSEFSMDANNNIAFRTGTNYSFDFIDFAIQYREYSKDFRSPFAQNFGEQSVAANEKGIYTGIEIKSFKNLLVSSYIDIYKSISRTYQIELPISGLDLLFLIQYQLNDKTSLTFKFRNEVRTDAIRDSINMLQILYDKNKVQARFQFDYQFSSKLRISQKYEYCFVDFQGNKSNENGNIIKTEISYKLFNTLRISTDYTLFNTDTYESAIWVLESNMPGEYRSPAYYGKGNKLAVVLSINVFDISNIYFIYYYTYKNKVRSIGSGLDEIKSNKINSINLQFEWNL